MHEGRHAGAWRGTYGARLPRAQRRRCASERSGRGIARFWTLVQVLVKWLFVRKAKDSAGPRRRALPDPGPVADAPPGRSTGRARAPRRSRSVVAQPERRVRAPRSAAKEPASRAPRGPSRAAPGEPSRSTRHPAGPRREAPRAPRKQTPEDMLERAMAARTSRARGLWARRGLGVAPRIDRTTQSMLLRQLYLAHYEERRFQKAFDVAAQAIELGVLPDVAHQDAARAKHALGDVDTAAGHLRLAARTSPAKRRAFHWWTLGSLYFLAHRYDEAISAMTRAARWGTTDKPLYQGHLAVIRCASGERVPELSSLLERLAEVPAGQGYGRFVLGQLAFYEGRRDDAKRYLEAFVKRSISGRAALAIALEGEIAVARGTLASLARGA